MKFIFACGGTGGHIFPAFSVAEELKRRDPGAKVLYICGKLDIENEIFQSVIREKVFSIESAPFKGGRSFLSPIFLIKLTKGLISAGNFLRIERPDAVVGFGGYFSFPVILAARMLGIPCLVHEQNVVPGFANRMLCPYVDGTALSFTETRAYLKRSVNARVTGNPVRISIERAPGREEALRYFGFTSDKRTVLVLGGSQGAESINTLFLEALEHLTPAFRKNFQALHLCGRMDPADARKRIEAAGVGARAFSFFDRMDLAYSVADVAVGRAGATFLAELATRRIPALLIPYPFGNGHQQLNAEVFSLKHHAVVETQKHLTAGKMARKLEGLAADVEGLGNLRVGKSQPGLETNARELLADFITEIATKNGG